MRFAVAFLMLAVALGAPLSGVAAPSASDGGACDARASNLGGIGRVTVFAFTGPVFGGRVCATVANLATDLITARVAGAGPYVIAPGGVIPAFGADIAELPRVVLAYAGQRTFLIATTPVALVDLAKELRTQPGAFGADAFERAVILASGPAAALSLRTADGTLGPNIGSPRILLIIKRG
jgi:hypothetical protein